VIRRPLVTCAAIALVALTGTGCSTFSSNSNAATANGHDLSISDFQTLITDFGGDTVNGEVSGTYARQVLTEWITTTVLVDKSDREDGVDQAARQEAENNYKQGNEEKWNALSPVSQKYLIDLAIAQDYFKNHPELISDADKKAAYEAGIETSKMLCARVIVAPDEATASAINGRLLAGEDFKKIADENPYDPSAAGTGGILKGNDGSECVSTTNTPADIVTALADTPIGQPSPAVPLSGSYVFFLQRPYEEIADAGSALLATVAQKSATSTILADASARVDSRYGMWDTSTSEVVAAR